MLGNNIRRLRKKSGLSLNSLSKLSGISVGYLSDLENNNKENPSMDILQKISDALNVYVEEFYRTDVVDPISIGERISSMREKKKMTQKELGDALEDIDIDGDNYNLILSFIYDSENNAYSFEDYIQKIEKGEVGFNTIILQKIAHILNVTCDYLENGDIEPKKSHYLESHTTVPSEFIIAEEARSYITMHQIFGANEFTEKMSDKEVLDFANEILRQAELISYKYKK